MNELTELFKKLVSIDSVSGEEENLSQFIFQYLLDLGLDPFQDSNNMIYCRVGEGIAPVLLCAHMDTVEPGRAVNVIERDGILTSNGETILGGDNKAAIAAILFSVRKSIEEGRNLNAELLFTVREETDSGIKDFDIKRIKAKLGFVFDMSGENLGQLVKSAPYIQDFEIEVIGKASHAAEPEEGVNAFEIVLDLKKYFNLGRIDEYSTFNIGIIAGGTATNTVPGKVLMKGDLRSSKKKNFACNKQFLDASIRKLGRLYNAEVKVRWIPYSFGYELSLENEHFNKVKEIYAANGIEINCVDTKGGSDAGFLNFNGIETYCLGDGVENPHTVNEKIEINRFNKLQQIVQSLITNI